uniref:uncharacterized protein n=1 Tax=Myxine glutinosa TaxID=7769 RepID=UPI00358EEF33
MNPTRLLTFSPTDSLSAPLPPPFPMALRMPPPPNLSPSHRSPDVPVLYCCTCVLPISPPSCLPLPLSYVICVSLFLCHLMLALTRASILYTKKKLSDFLLFFLGSIMLPEGPRRKIGFPSLFESVLSGIETKNGRCPVCWHWWTFVDVDNTNNNILDQDGRHQSICSGREAGSSGVEKHKQDDETDADHENRLTACDTTLLWPPHSPDVTTCDNALWEYVKSEVAEHRMTSVDELKQCIQEAFGTITHGIFHPFSHRTWRKIILCRDNGKCHPDALVVEGIVTIAILLLYVIINPVMYYCYYCNMLLLPCRWYKQILHKQLKPCPGMYDSPCRTALVECIPPPD